MIVLSNEEVEQLLTIRDYHEVLEVGFGDLARGEAVWRPRSDMSIPPAEGRPTYRLKTMDGAVPRYKMAAVRINSDVVTFSVRHGTRVQDKVPAAQGQYYVGFVLLFDTETGEPLALFPDGIMQRMRVAATSGLGAKYLAREDATVVGLLGSGWQAGSQLMALCDVRPIRLVKVYSPTREHRERFAQEMAAQAGVEVRPVDSVPEALAGADIVTLATNARDVLIRWADIEPGMHVTSLRWPNFGTDIFRNADVVVSNARPVGRWQPGPSAYVYLHDYVMGDRDITTLYGGDPRLDPTSPEYVDWSALPDLGDLIAGKGPYRTDHEQVTVHANNIGIALQFAAAGARLLERALQRGAGREIPTEWFLQTVHP